jgi:hypothetical protein
MMLFSGAQHIADAILSGGQFYLIRSSQALNWHVRTVGEALNQHLSQLQVYAVCPAPQVHATSNSCGSGKVQIAQDPNKTPQPHAVGPTLSFSPVSFVDAAEVKAEFSEPPAYSRDVYVATAEKASVQERIGMAPQGKKCRLSLIAN